MAVTLTVDPRLPNTTDFLTKFKYCVEADTGCKLPLRITRLRNSGVAWTFYLCVL